MTMMLGVGVRFEKIYKRPFTERGEEDKWQEVEPKWWRGRSRGVDTWHIEMAIWYWWSPFPPLIDLISWLLCIVFCFVHLFLDESKSTRANKNETKLHMHQLSSHRPFWSTRLTSGSFLKFFYSLTCYGINRSYFFSSIINYWSS